MLKHLEDGGDIVILIDNAGQMLYRCLQCGEMWTGSAQPFAKIDIKAAGSIRSSLHANRGILSSLNFDLNAIDTVIGKP
jgi:hypothetical protein